MSKLDTLLAELRDVASDRIIDEAKKKKGKKKSKGRKEKEDDAKKTKIRPFKCKKKNDKSKGKAKKNSKRKGKKNEEVAVGDMNQILENLNYVIGEEALAKANEETTSGAVAPYTTPLGKQRPSTDPAVEDDDEINSSSAIGDTPRDADPSGDSSFYDPESPKADYPYAKPGATESNETPKTPDPAGKPALGKGKQETGGDSVFYGDEKDKSKYPHKYDPKKPGGTGKTGSVEKVQSKYPHKMTKNEADEIMKLQQLAEEDPPQPDAQPAATDPTPEPDVAPSDEPSGEPSDEPERTEWEIYAISDDLEAIAARAKEAVRSAVGDSEASLAIKFRGDEAAKTAAIDALGAGGFNVLGTEEEPEQPEPAAEPAAEPEPSPEPEELPA